MTVVRIPPVLRANVGGVKEVPVTGTTVGQALAALIERHPSLRDQLMTPEGDLNRFELPSQSSRQIASAGLTVWVPIFSNARSRRDTR